MELGRAGAVATRTAAGMSVVYLLVTRGEAGIVGMPPAEAAAVGEAEQRANAGIVGSRRWNFSTNPTGSSSTGCRCAATSPQRSAGTARSWPSGYNHRDETFTRKWNTADYRNTGRALLDAVGDAGNRWLFPGDGAEPWPRVKYLAMHSSPRPTHAVDVTDGVDAAVASLEGHREYLRGLGYGDASVRPPLVGLYTQTGKRFGDRLAIRLELIDR
jgi:LmbE family N-acetylglucosaminyl deacetylase